MLNPYGYISLSLFGIYDPISKNFNFDLKNSELEPLKIKSESTVYNISSFCEIMALMVMFHIVSYILSLLMSRCNVYEKCLCCIKIVKCLLARTIDILTFSYYIRSVMEFTQIMLVSAINEINNWDTSQFLRVVSLVVAHIVLLFYIMLSGIILYLALSSYKFAEDKHNKIGECFRGIKPNKKHKLFVFILFLRRIVFLAITITFTFIKSQPMIVFLIIAVRPFKEVKANFIKIQNELYFLLLLSSLAYYNSEDDWKSTTSSVYIWVLASNSMLTLLVVIADIIRRIVVKCKSHRQTPLVRNQSITKVTPKVAERSQKKDDRLAEFNNRKSKLSEMKVQHSSQLREESKQDFDDHSSHIRIIDLSKD